MSLPRHDDTATAIAPMLTIAIVLVAVAVKVGFGAYLGGRVYPDVYRALNYGWLIAQGAFSIRSDVINDKTFLGPLLWTRVYAWAGINGLLAFNLAAFVALCGVQYGLGRGRYDGWTRAVALVLFAFYVGTHRNVAAGEPDDNLAALLFGLGLWIYLDTRRVLTAGLCIGVGFLFKFWVAIFGLGFAVYLAWKRPWRELGWALGGMGLPFLALNGIDGMASFRALFLSVDIQSGYSGWGELGFKLLSTGLLPMAVLTTWAWWRRRDDLTALLCLVSIAYAVYAVVNRDAFAASFVMMLCMLFASFLLAQTLLAAVEALPRRRRARVVGAVLAAYVVLTSGVTYHNLYRDTEPIVVLQTEAAAREMFPHNY
jgi:hypothetical protein